MNLRLQSVHQLAWGILIGYTLLLWIATTAQATTPDAGERGNYRGQCRKLTRQIDHYENTVLPMAIERGNRAWEDATNDQVERLWNRRADLCPKYGAERSLLLKARDQARRFNKFVAQAARAAAAYFSGGLTGGIGP
jgi:hypothetical protein